MLIEGRGATLPCIDEPRARDRFSEIGCKSETARQLKLHATPYLEHRWHWGLVSSHYNQRSCQLSFPSTPNSEAWTETHLKLSKLAIAAPRSGFFYHAPMRIHGLSVKAVIAVGECDGQDNKKGWWSESGAISRNPNA